MNDFYSCQCNFVFDNNDGVMSMEFSYNDSNDIHCASYKEGTDILTLANDIFDDIESQIADADDFKADLEEMERLDREIRELSARLEELKLRTNTSDLIDDSLGNEKKVNKEQENKVSPKFKNPVSYYRWLFGEEE